MVIKGRHSWAGRVHWPTARNADRFVIQANQKLLMLSRSGSQHIPAAYMSPEQAEGKPLDTRSDIFSFGSVVYEMVTGKRAFHGETIVSTVSAILTKDPKPVREIVENAPADLDRIIALCLQKEPKRRFQHIDDVGIELERLRNEDYTVIQPASVIRSKTRAGSWTYLSTAFILFAVGAGIGHWAFGPKTMTPAVLERLTANSGFATDPAVSANGTLLAYASDRGGEGNLDIWVRQLAGGEPGQLTHDPADDHQPGFSPDGTRIAFRSERDGGGIYVMAALGGDARLIARQACWPSFSPDGTQVAYSAAPAFFAVTMSSRRMAEQHGRSRRFSAITVRSGQRTGGISSPLAPTSKDRSTKDPTGGC